MICTVDVDVQSANPDFPLKEWKAFKGSPTSLRIRNVPRKVGAWDITAVNVKCVYPDNTAHVIAAVLTGCVWVATIPASDAVGSVDGGYSIEADGTDERGNAVTGYRLGEGKVTILDVAVSAHAVDGIEFVRIVESKPETPRKGDLVLGSMEIFDGFVWQSFGGVPADYATVRANAATGAAHAAKTDDPHHTSLVIELTVDKRLVLLDAEGKQTAKVYTSFDELFDLVMTGRVSLYHYAAGTTGRKALYRPHLVSEDGTATPAMRFDATGTLGSDIYTRTISATKTGTDGIAVTIGDLTKMAKDATKQDKLTSAQLANIAAVPAKRDKTDRTFEREVGPGEFDLSEVERLHPLPTRYTYKVQPYHYTDGKWYLEIATYDGSEEEDQIALSAESADSSADALAMESFTIGVVSPRLPQSYADLVSLRINRKPSTVEDTLALTSEIPDVSNLASKAELTNATKLTPVYSEWKITARGPEAVSMRVDLTTDGWVIVHVVQTGPETTYEIKEPTGESDPNAIELTGLSYGSTATRTIDHYVTARGEKILAGTIAGVFATPAFSTAVENETKVTASTALALKDRDCCLVPFTANMTFTFTAKEEGKTGLRSFEVIVTGCAKDGAVNWPAVTYRGDSADLIPDDGDNHWTFAEQQDGSFAVTRHVANTFTIGE